jgi:hypothetical protein
LSFKIVINWLQPAQPVRHNGSFNQFEEVWEGRINIWRQIYCFVDYVSWYICAIRTNRMHYFTLNLFR